MADTPDTATDSGDSGQIVEPGRPVRRRASRAAGPASADGASATLTTAAGPAAAPTSAPKVSMTMTVAPPPRRRPNLGSAVLAGSLCALVLAAGLGWGVWQLNDQRHAAAAAEARQQRFVDTAQQTVVNMFSYTQDDIDKSVNTFVDGTSGPLRDMLSQNQNVDNLKSMFRDTHASSEAVVNGAALERIDETSDNASVLVAVRVTVTDIDGVNKPSQAYRLRVIVHEDDNGRMTGYDLKYPDGGN